MLDDYGVARGTLREALRFLETQGVLTMKPGRGGGAIVDTPDERPLATAIALLLQFSESPYRMILEARMAFEPTFAAIAARRATAEQVEAINRSVVEMRGTIESMQPFLAENQRFHQLVAQATGNNLFEIILSSLRWISDGTAVGIAYPEEHRRGIVKYHEQIAVGITARDPDAAAEAMRAHMQDFLDYIEERYPELAEKPLRWDQIA